MTRFSNDAPMLDKIVDGIPASDTPADLHARARRRRRRAARSPEPADRARLRRRVPRGAARPRQVGADRRRQARRRAPTRTSPRSTSSNIDVRYVPVGHRSDNVGIIAFNVRRYIANKAAYEVFIEVQNFGQEPAHRKLTLYNGDRPPSTSRAARPRARPARAPDLPEAARRRGQPAARRARARSTGAGGTDAFALDDTAFALLPARKKQKVLMVTEDNLFLEGALLVYDNVDPLKVSPAEYDAKPSHRRRHGRRDLRRLHARRAAAAADAACCTSTRPARTRRSRSRGDVARPAHHRDRRGPPGDALGDDVRRLHGQERACSRPIPRRARSTLAFSVTDSIIAAQARRPAQDPRVRVLAAVGRPRQRDRPADARRVPDAARQRARLVRRRSGRSAHDVSDRPARARAARRRGRRDRGRGQGPDGTITHTPVIDGLATFYGSRVGYYDLAAKGADGHAMAQIELAANLASPSESRHRAVGHAHARRQEARGARGVRDHAQPEAVDLPRAARGSA